MFKSRTVFIVGAGASHELDFPLGHQLKGKIAKKVSIAFQRASNNSSGDPLIVEAIRWKCRDPREDVNRYFQAGREIAEALPLEISIDNYLEVHSHDEHKVLMGKLGIASSILDEERASKLFLKPGERLDFSEKRLQDSWLTQLVRFTAENITKAKAVQTFQNVSFIVFNYDRTLETFLWHAMQRHFGVSAESAAEIISHAAFHHPYGSVGQLPWQQGDSPVADYGDQVEPNHLLELASGIQTYAEQIESQRHQRVLQSLLQAKTVIFLGFGFIRQNMELLKLPEAGDVTRVFATAYGLSEHNCGVVKKMIGELLHRPLNVNPRRELTASQLFSEYSLTIST